MSGGTGFGITQQGFVAPQLTDIQSEIDGVLQAKFGAGINLQPQSFFGQLSGTFAEREASLWAGLQDVYNSQNPATAFGASLDNVGALRGNPRQIAKPSTVQNVRLFGSAGTVVPTSAQFSVAGSPTSLFSPLNVTTLVAGASCVQRLTFSGVPASGTYQVALSGNDSALINWNDNIATVQAKIQALEFASGCVVTQISSTVLQIAFAGAGTGGLMVQPIFVVTEDALQDGSSVAITITPSITTAGVDQGNVALQAIVDGPTIANAGTLTVIATPITGLSGVLNTQDATLGQNVETDNAYKIRMEEELDTAGAATYNAIKSVLLEITGVTTVLIFENDTEVVDDDGRPPHSYECVVNGGDTATIAEAIWQSKPVGIATFGNTPYTITDSQGQTHIINFSRPTAVPVYIIANITTDSTYPSDGDSLVATALATYGSSLGIGAELIVIPKLISQLASIPGIQDATLLVGTSPGPTESNNITPSAFEILEFDTSRITVNS